MTYKEAVTKADNIDVALRYIIKPNTTTASAMILEEVGSLSMWHLFKEEGEEALGDFVKRLEEKNKEIREEYLSWYFKQTNQHEKITIRVSPHKTTIVKLSHEINDGVSWASIDNDLVAVYRYNGTQTSGAHFDNLKREASYQLGLKVYQSLNFVEKCTEQYYSH